MLARDTAGDGVIGWHREEELNETLSGIEASTLRRGASWSPAAVLKATRQGGGAYAPQVGIGPTGAATALWHGLARLEASTFPGKGGWSHPGFVSSMREEPQPARLAVDAHSGVKAVFASRRGKSFTIELATGGPRSGRRAARTLASSRYPFEEPQIATDARGETLIAWVSGGPRPRLRALVLSPQGRSGPAQTVASMKTGMKELHLAANARGEAILAWRAGGGRVEAARRAAGARFGHAVVVSRGADSELTATIESGGEAIVLFTHSGKTVEAAAQRPRARWSAPTQLTPGRETTEPQIAADPSGGAAVAVWATGRSGSHAGAIEATTRGLNGGWQQPVTVFPAGSFSPAVAVSANGSATAAWVSEAPGLGFETVEAADFAP